MNESSKSKKIVIIIGITVMALVVVGICAFFAINLIKRSTTSVPSAPISNTPTVKETPKMTIKESKVDKQNNNLSITTNIETKEQGDCTITLKNDTSTFTLTNSTKGVEGRTGCLDWNIGTASLPKGKYDVTIQFVGEKDKFTTNQSIVVE